MVDDIWAIGICMYKLLTNNFPFTSNNEIEVFIKIKNG